LKAITSKQTYSRTSSYYTSKNSFFKVYPVLENKLTATQDSTMTIPTTTQSENRGNSLLRHYQIFQHDLLQSGIMITNTEGRDVGIYLGEEKKNTTKKHKHMAISHSQKN
jgi:hypothetical protein